MEKLLTTKQVAQIFGVDNRTVLYNFIPKGLKFLKVGSRDYRFVHEDIERFIEEQKQQEEQYEFIDRRTNYQKRMNSKLRVV